ncbi:hypothetical protein BGZ83_006755 [Gryganskiella cystojenkinii]|nr:hypothetical protein BGZ83_006755 [Gryganskiella cystojenkinii]
MKPSGSSFLGATLFPTVLLFCSTSSWITTPVEANIVFDLFPANFTVKPGQHIALNWTQSIITNNSLVNNGSFSLELWAKTGQKYTIKNSVTQTPLTFPVVIPTEATGGLHSFYAIYLQGDTKMVSSNQFNVTGKIQTTTQPPPPPATSTVTTVPPSNTPTTGADTGMSGGAIGGIIIGVVALLLLIALIFFCRHRRRRAVDGDSPESRSMDDRKESKHQDKESLTRGAGPVDGAMVPVPLGSGGPNLTGPRPYGASQGSQPQLQQNQHLPQPPPQQQQGVPGGVRNPFENAERIPSPGPGIPRQQQQQQYPYQPPQISPNTGGYPPNNSPYGQPNPMMQPPHQVHQQQQLVRGQSPFGLPMATAAAIGASNRDSFASELESVYDPRMMNSNGPYNGGNSVTPDMAMMRSSPNSGSSLTHSSSGRRYPGQQQPNSMPQTRSNLSPQPEQQQQSRNNNPFAEQDRESMALAAAIAAAAASPVLTNRQKHQQEVESRSQSPANMMAMEMQPLDIQQHHFEQQQRMQQRQQQPQPSPLGHKQTRDPRFFDDKAEIEEEDAKSVQHPHYQQQQQQQDQQIQKQLQAQQPKVVAVEEEQAGPAYTGYRDTIFGAYAPQADDEDEEEEIQHRPPQMPITSAPVPATQYTENGDPLLSGGAVVQRKKSVKFTGVPATGPVVLLNHEAVREHQNQKMMRQKEEEALNNHQQQIQRPDTGEDFYGDDDDYEEDEEDIRSRMMETESAAVIHSPRGPFNPPVRSHNSPSLDTVSAFGNGFYEDVIAAVDKKGVTSPTSPSGSTMVPSSVPLSPSSTASSGTVTTTPTYVRPPMPKVPASEPEAVAHQHQVSTQILPVPQPVNQEIFGAPSPRMTPAAKMAGH